MEKTVYLNLPKGVYVNVCISAKGGYSSDVVIKDDKIEKIKVYKDDNKAPFWGVKEDADPFPLYRKAGIPLVISTDDPRILRTNLTQQYVFFTSDSNINICKACSALWSGIL